MSMLAVLLLAGVAFSKHISYYDNDAFDEPIISKSQERRICAELCMSGLGGEPCGESCEDIIPQGLPTPKLRQSRGDRGGTHSGDHNISEGSRTARKSACPVLCANRLGYPLCGCNTTIEQYYSQPFFRVNYVEICTFFCITYDYQLFGCHKCDSYKTQRFTVNTIKKAASGDGVDWNKWCIDMCAIGDGGAACNCDLLPMSLKITP